MQALELKDVEFEQFRTWLHRSSGISGSTILGSGEGALILDVPSLVQQAVQREAQQVSIRPTANPALAC